MKILKRNFLIIGILYLLLSLTHAFAEKDIQVDLYENNLILNEDYTYTNTFKIIKTALTFNGVASLQTWSMDFFPNSQKLEIIEACIIHADGTRIPVMSENIFTRPSSAMERAPKFDNSYETSIFFPQLRVGSHIYIIAKLVQTKPDPIGFSKIFTPPFFMGIKDFQIRITLPKALKLDWKERGGFKVQDKILENIRVVEAHLKNVPSHVTQNSMEDSLGFAPIFIASAIPSWDDIGEKLFTAFENNQSVSQRIKDLSTAIVQQKKGEEAVEALYNWLMKNIETVESTLNSDSGFKAHTLDEILNNGMGDSKDKVALMLALLKAQGIKSFPVLVSSDLYKPLPLPSMRQFNQMIIYLPDFNIFANLLNPFSFMGTLGETLDGKFFVMGTSQGKSGYLPVSKPENNTYEDINSIEIFSNGTIKGKNSINTTGEIDSWMRQDFFENSAEYLAQDLLDQLRDVGYGNFAVYGNPQDLSNPFKANGTWTSPDALSFGEIACFWVPIGLDWMNPFSLRSDITPQKRIYPFVTFPSQLTWSYDIKIPEGYMIKQLPKGISLENSGGSYKSTYTAKGDIIFVKRSYRIEKSYFTAEEYEKFIRPLLYALETEAHAVLALQKRSKTVKR